MCCPARRWPSVRAGLALIRSRSVVGPSIAANFAQAAGIVNNWIQPPPPSYTTNLVYRYDRLTAVLSRKSKYGLKALLVLARKRGAGRC